MRVLGSAVLGMEALLIGFAMLLAMDHQSAISIWLGFIIFLLLILTAGIMKRRIALYIGSALQLALIAYGFYVTAMFYMGALFGGLWVAAIVVGRKGEAIRAQLLLKKSEK